MSPTKERIGFITPEKEYKKLFLWGLIASLVACLFFYLDNISAKNREFNELITTEGTLIKGFSTALLKTYKNKTIYFPLRGGKFSGGSYYQIRLKEFYNRKVKIWWYSNNPHEPFYKGNFIYQMEVEGKLVLTYAEQKARFSRSKYFISTLSSAVALLLFLFSVIGYMSSKDIKPIH